MPELEVSTLIEWSLGRKLIEFEEKIWIDLGIIYPYETLGMGIQFIHNGNIYAKIWPNFFP